MPILMKRRPFLTAVAGAFAMAFAVADFLIASEKDKVPALLDHILLGCGNLESGIEFVEKQTGVKAAFGGVHPGRGTQNALLSLGEGHYLEIMAPDPGQAGATDPRAVQLRKLETPKLVGWAAHPGDIEVLAQKLKEHGVGIEGPRAGSRKSPDGRVLNWKTLGLAEDFGGLLPFFIEWGAGTVHPSVDAPAGCRILSFEIATPEPEKLKEVEELLALGGIVGKGNKAELRVRIAGPKGEILLTS